MKILVYLVGKKRNSLESNLFDQYILNFNKLSQSLKLSNIKVIYIENRKTGNLKDEILMFEKKINKGTYKIFLDVEGKKLSSIEFSKKIFHLRDIGIKTISFVIGGPNGIPETYKKNSDFNLSLGDMTWPHEMAKVLLSEQIYRSINIKLGTPYHK